MTKHLTALIQDFDQSRIPTLMEKLLPVERQKQTAGGGLEPQKENIEEVKVVKVKEEGRNRAVVVSDSEGDRSDTSIEEEEEEIKPKKKKLKKKI